MRATAKRIVLKVDALRIVAVMARRPAVALIDIGLPGMNGYELAKKIRTQLGDQPIRLVALTGYGRAADRDAVLNAGFDDHLFKPVTPEDLARALTRKQ